MELDVDSVREAVGKLLMQARDSSIDAYASTVGGSLRSSAAISIAEMARGQEQEVLQAGIYAIDSFLVAFLSYLEDESESLSLGTSSVSIADYSDGLAGELFGNNGWISRYSKYDEIT